MRLTYHVLFPGALLPTLMQWQRMSIELGFAVEFEAALLSSPLSAAKLVIGISSRGAATTAQISTSPSSDVADICDELYTHITEDQNLAVTIAFNDDADKLPPVSIIVATLAKMTNATVYIEGDGVFCSADEAMATARGWEQEK